MRSSLRSWVGGANPAYGFRGSAVARRPGRLHRPGIRVCGAGLVGPTQTTDFVGRLTRRLGQLHRRRLGQLHRPSVRIRMSWISWSGSGPRSEEHTSELQSLMRISYAVFCLKKKKKMMIGSQNVKTNII